MDGGRITTRPLFRGAANGTPPDRHAGGGEMLMWGSWRGRRGTYCTEMGRSSSKSGWTEPGLPTRYCPFEPGPTDWIEASFRLDHSGLAPVPDFAWCWHRMRPGPRLRGPPNHNDRTDDDARGKCVSLKLDHQGSTMYQDDNRNKDQKKSVVNQTGKRQKRKNWGPTGD